MKSIRAKKREWRKQARNGKIHKLIASSSRSRRTADATASKATADERQTNGGHDSKQGHGGQAADEWQTCPAISTRVRKRASKRQARRRLPDNKQ